MPKSTPTDAVEDDSAFGSDPEADTSNAVEDYCIHAAELAWRDCRETLSPLTERELDRDEPSDDRTG